MKKNTKFYLIITSLLAIISGLIALIFSGKKDLTVKEMKDSFKLSKNSKGTQQLPQTKNTDAIISELEQDILNNNK